MSLFGKVHARCYDRFMDRIDRARAGEHRRRLVESGGMALPRIVRPHVIGIAERPAA